MTRPLFGASVDPDTIGDRQTGAAPTVPAVAPPIALKKYLRNAMHPMAELQNRLNQAANQANLYRSREHYSLPFVPFGGNGSFYVNGDLCRFAFRTGPYSTAIFARMVMSTPFAVTANAYSYITLSIYSDAAMSTLVSTTRFDGPGNTESGGSGATQWSAVMKVDKAIAGLTPDTAYYAKITSVQGALLVGACVWDCPSLTESLYGGYLAQNYTTHTTIIGTDRSNAHTLAKNAWKRGAGKLFNWSAPVGIGANSDSTDGYRSITTTSSTYTNILDLTSTGVSSSTPGFYLDGTYRNRRSQTTIPCVLKAFGRRESPSDGEVVVKNSSGTILATVTGFGTSNAWVSTTLNLPASSAKYDVHFRTTGGGDTFHLYDVIAYQLE